ncbi:DUF6287 domain-containing protein [Enterococcus faecalis]|uniref:DUF6287 domain-containing protein n=1 Tax=Enterococcus faecalis TaxID=1351 RepID=UPI001E4E84FE|nr:DUF6287 domain-containing protein [Enterococcus faecalis]MCD4907126.1 hypothetical protein [Enterococcus faecalis]
MQEEQNRVEKTKKKKKTKKAILIILLLLVVGGGIFLLVNSKSMLTEQITKNKAVITSSDSNSKENSVSTSNQNASSTQISNTEDDKTNTSTENNDNTGYSSLNINQRISLMARLYDKLDFKDFVSISYNITELPDGTQNVVITNYGLNAHTETIAYKVDKTSINPSSFPSDQITTKNDLFKIYEQDKDQYDELAEKVNYDSSLEFSQNYKETSQVETSNNQDLNIEAINNGDISTLAGTWKNGNGDVLIINSDGTTNKGYTIHTLVDSDKKSKIPYAELSDGATGAALGLYKIGFENPEGDKSDKTRPRLTISQQGGIFAENSYYYRQ